MIVKIKIIAASTLFSLSISAQTEGPIIGKWKGEYKPDKQSEVYLGKVRFYNRKIIKYFEDKGTLGKIILKNFKYDPKTSSFIGKM